MRPARGPPTRRVGREWGATAAAAERSALRDESPAEQRPRDPRSPVETSEAFPVGPCWYSVQPKGGRQSLPLAASSVLTGSPDRGDHPSMEDAVSTRSSD